MTQILYSETTEKQIQLVVRAELHTDPTRWPLDQDVFILSDWGTLVPYKQLVTKLSFHQGPVVTHWINHHSLNNGLIGLVGNNWFSQYLRRCYAGKYARTIFAETLRRNVGITLQPFETISQQRCNAVLG